MPKKRRPRKSQPPPPDKPAPQKRLPDVGKVGEQVAALNGNLAAVARSFGVSRSSVWELVQKHPELQAAVKDARESMTDHAESALFRSILAGEGWAVCFYLKTQGKSRGYVERQEIDLKAGNRLVIEEEVVGGDAHATG